MNDEDKNNLSILLTVLKIAQVICVDDNYSEAPDEGQVKAVFQKIPIDKIDEIPDEDIKKLKKVEENDIRLDKFMEIWEKLEPSQKTKYYSAMVSIIYSESIEDFEIFNNLKDLFSTCEFDAMSPERWEKEIKAVIKKAKQEKKIMMLFDMDLSHGNGKIKSGIEEIIKIKNNENIVCGLITHKYDIDNENEQWEKISCDHSIKKENFLFISKNRLKPENIKGFLKMLKLITINRIAAKMKMEAKEILEKANEKAYKRLENLDIRDFDYIICRSAQTEGLWEPDMLFRIYNTYLKHEAEQITLSDTNLQQWAVDIRKASQVTEPFEPTKVGIAYEIEERYKTAEYLNKNHFPIELGDIFSNGNSKYFILLSQPCELMIRSNGRRGYSMNDALLVEIQQESDQKDTDSNKEEDRFSKAIIEYWRSETNKKYFINFRKKYITKLCILDLCVFNPEGKSSYKSEASCPATVWPPWQAYYKDHIKNSLEKIGKFYKDLKNSNSTVVTQVKKYFRTYAIEPFRIKHIENKGENFCIEFNCERVGRLCKERASDLLSQYAFLMSRAAFERDLGKNLT